ncbi:hypothetical protein MTBPR1_140014 [Candidatus Terasakiella magnetica]|uniref:Uncharacterized protein n=1 Tax=Candidatus Terasakiella magnetica TaxID=1867952 RepID=A0A1C3RF30_9PROT|nr:hypothetical protein MTBPR1_140014 [Candidatus Terasakiella magnetica]
MTINTHPHKQKTQFNTVESKEGISHSEYLTSFVKELARAQALHDHQKEVLQ